MIRRFVVSVCATIAIPGSVLAAQGAGSPPTSQVGANELRIVLMAVIRQVGEEVANGALSTTARPWAIQVPDTSNALWRTVRSGLYGALHGRPVTPADSSSSYTALELGPVTVRGDTLTASLSITEFLYCQPSPNLVIGSPGRSEGTSSFVKFTSIREGRYWLPSKVVDASLVHGVCMYKGKP